METELPLNIIKINAVEAGSRATALANVWDEATGKEMVTAIERYPLLAFHDSHVKAKEYRDLGWGMGQILMITDQLDGGPTAHPEYEEISEITNARNRGQKTTIEWHHDLSFVKEMATYVLLKANDIADDTVTDLCDMHEVYNSLSPERLEFFKGKEIVYQNQLSPNGKPIPGKTYPDDNLSVITCPILQFDQGGRPVVFPGPAYGVRFIKGIPLDEGIALLDELLAMVDKLGFGYRWKTGTLLVWDNIRYMHCVREHDNTQPRGLSRVTVRKVQRSVRV